MFALAKCSEGSVDVDAFGEGNERIFAETPSKVHRENGEWRLISSSLAEKHRVICFPESVGRAVKKRFEERDLPLSLSLSLSPSV